ncbi:MAG: hypothetical protein QF381_03340 [Nitrososphaerales archaeon]|nr:hypothetical protein [Nitrososphaerales archaeon]
MKRDNNLSDIPRIAVATVDAKAYYALSSLLNEMNLSFESVSPYEDINSIVQLIFTTHKEKKLIKSRKVLCFEDISGIQTIAKEMIFSRLFSSGEDMLLIGIDPGDRTGIILFYRGIEILNEVTLSLDKTLSTLTNIITNSQAKQKVVRIGDGDLKKTNYIAGRLFEEFKELIDIEIVNENGTSKMTNLIRFKGPKDLRSARIISLRRGKRYQGDSSR